MAHLFYEEADDINCYSAMVACRSNGQIVLPKRYFTLKHFTNLVKPGYKRIDTEVSNINLYASAFISGDEKEIVVQLLNDSDTQEISLDIPLGITSISHYTTSDTDDDNFEKNQDL